jgi:YHS domain-containing protein
MRTLKTLTISAIAAALAAVAAVAFNPATMAAQDAVNTLDSESGVAIKGYDPVAYFKEGAPHKGKPEFTADYKGATWRFASAENKALFAADPEKYAPAYGGYCAFGVSQGYLVKIEPEAFSIRDGRLYLNYDRSVKAKWLKQPDDYIHAADKNWPGLIAKK